MLSTRLSEMKLKKSVEMISMLINVHFLNPIIIHKNALVYSNQQIYLYYFLQLYPSSATAEIRTITHNEEIVDSYGPNAHLHVLDARIYDDGTAVIRIIIRKARLNAASCSFEMLFLRIIHSNRKRY